MTHASASPSSPTTSSGIAGTAARQAHALDELTTRHADMLERMGIWRETADSMGIVTALVPGGGDWIGIPYRRHGITYGHKFRRLDGKDFQTTKGAKLGWFNADALADPTLADAPVIVCEGELDALIAIQAGFGRAISAPHGAQPKSGSESFLATLEADFRGCRDIVLAVDGDEPGVALMNRLAVALGKGRCRYVAYPEGCKDLRDIALNVSQGAVVEAINRAPFVKVSGLFRMSELPPVADPTPYSSMIPLLHEHYRIRRGDFCVMTGIPGHGKSTFVNDLACRMVHHHGWNVAFASFEQHPQIDHKRALRTWYSSKPASTQTQAELAAADAWIDANFSFIIPDDDDPCDLQWLLQTMAAAVVRHRVDLCIIDPWNELDHARPKDQSLTEYVGSAIRQLKAFARYYDVHLIVVAHPTKIQKDKDGKLPIPSLYDISDSAHWFNKPDVGVVVHRVENITQIRVAKSRYHDSIGKPGTVDLAFNTYNARYGAA